MGFDASAEVGVGFPVEFLQQSVVTGTVKKFNPDTGEPYEKDVTKDVMVAKIEGKEVCREDEWEYRSRLGSVDGLEVHQTGYESGPCWAGKVIIAANSIGSGPSKTLQEFKFEMPQEVIEFANKHGVTPKWILATNG